MKKDTRSLAYHWRVRSLKPSMLYSALERRDATIARVTLLPNVGKLLPMQPTFL